MSDRRPEGTITFEELLDRHRRSDPAFAAEWERTAFARDVSLAVLRYRTARGLTLETLAERLGVHPEVVGVLEDGEDDPDIGTLRLLTERLGLRFAIDIHPGPDSRVEMTHSVA